MVAKSPNVASYFFRDLAEGFQQQMFFWGQDVLQLEGNFLIEQGFERGPSTGLNGTSCYRRDWQNGHVELYGACAGWYGRDRGFTFIRPHRRCSIWLSGEETPIPGAWQTDFIDKTATNDELYLAALPFLDWLISYESAVLARFGRAYREANYRKYQKVPKRKAWVEPSVALRWFQCFRETPDQLVRPKYFSTKNYT